MQPGKERILRDVLQFGRVEPAFCLGRVVEAGGNHAGAQAQLSFAFGFGALLVVESLRSNLGERFGFFGGVDNADEPGGRVVGAVSHSVRTVGRELWVESRSGVESINFASKNRRQKSAVNGAADGCI